MPVSVVVGGQYGSEGKGKVAHWFAKAERATAAVRVGGPNSGHTVISSTGARLIFRQLPTAAILPDVCCVLAAGSYVVPSLLASEVEMARLPDSRLIVDPNAVVISEREIAEEQSSTLRATIGSTNSGTGAAVVARVSRRGQALLARDEPSLTRYVTSASEYLRGILAANARVIVEGTQGFGLSVLHSPHYPFATSRDTSAAGFLSEVGLSPLDVDDVILVLRAFPIRVAGASGPLPGEIDWEQISRESGSKIDVTERTSVTKFVRRVGRFDAEIVRLAITCNAPTRIVLNHLDHIEFAASRGQTAKTIAFVEQVERDIARSVTHIGLGASHLERLR